MITYTILDGTKQVEASQGQFHSYRSLAVARLYLAGLGFDNPVIWQTEADGEIYETNAGDVWSDSLTLLWEWKYYTEIAPETYARNACLASLQIATGVSKAELVALFAAGKAEAFYEGAFALLCQEAAWQATSPANDDSDSVKWSALALLYAREHPKFIISPLEALIR